MTSDGTNTGVHASVTNPAGVPGRRFSSAAVIGAGLVGLVLGAIATFAVTGLVSTVRVELPPPPYPPPLTSNGPGCVYPAPSPGVVPMPPLPPVPHAHG